MWDKALGLLGATAGLAAVLYAAGAAIAWIRYAETGYDPATALQHQPQTNMIALGAQGALVVTGLVLVMLGVRWFFGWVSGWRIIRWVVRWLVWPFDRALAWAAKFTVRRGDYYDQRVAHRRRVFRSKVAGWVTGKGRWLCVGLVVVTLFLTWRIVALAVLVWACYEATRHYSGRPKWDDLSSLSVGKWVLLVGAAAAIIVLWQVTPEVHSTGVVLEPAPTTTHTTKKDCHGKQKPRPLADVQIPYFGQDGSYVYADVVSCFWSQGKPHHKTNHYYLSHRISQLPLANYKLVELTSGVTLGGPTATPVCSLLSRAKAGIDSLQVSSQAQAPSSGGWHFSFWRMHC